ncbi:helix-turn-helix transcriptional regulator [Nocardioides marmoriginsengisoli]|uniref:helix-turn-helix transcriptional regulator n=1 Tax=Nocardioides marmoriginsengisoli TaxID=661483 RepID=UPI00160ADA7B|nr:LuxR family transcriptional regulator [Nocardioides marmoriginsengisoli]
MLQERSEQLHDLHAWLRGGTGMLVVVGDPGSGKTALLDMASGPVPLIRVAARSADANVPFATLRAVHAELGRPDVLGTELSTAGHLLPEASPAERAAKVAEVAAALAAALSGAVLVVDDLHWADPPSLEILGQAVRADGTRLLAASRPWSAEHHTPVARLAEKVDGVTIIRALPLSVDGVRAMLSTPTDDERVLELHRRTAGLPLLVQALEQGNSRSLQEYVAAELVRAGPAAARVARALAVLAGRGTLADVAHLSEVPVRQLSAELRALWQAGMIADGSALRLRHPLLEDLVLEEGGSAASLTLHAQAAKLCASRPDSAAVGLLLRSAPVGEAWAERLLLDAAREASSAADPRLCSVLASRGLMEQTGDHDRWGELLALQATALLALGAADAVPAAESNLAALNKNQVRRWAREIRLAMTEYAMLRDHSAAASLHADALADDAQEGEGGDAHWRTRALLAYLGATIIAEETSSARLAVLDREAALVSAGTPESLPLAAYAASAYAAAGRDADADNALASISRDALEASPERLVGLGLVGVALVHLERLDQARSWFADVHRIADRHGVAPVRINAAAFLALIDAWLGNTAALTAPMPDLVSEAVFPIIRPIAYAAIVENALLRDDDPTLESVLALARAELEATPLTAGPGIAALLVVCARAEVSLGRPRPALELLDAAQAAHPQPGWLAPWPAVRADVRRALGIGMDPIDADILQAWARSHRPLTVSLAQGPLSRIRETTYAPTEPAADLPAPLRCELLIADGAELRRRGRQLEARTFLTAALHLAHDMKFDWLAERSRTELRLAGGRASRPRPFGLTAAEIRVAALASRGWTNREIAEALVVAPKTVESHMSQALMKIGRPRAELSELREAFET